MSLSERNWKERRFFRVSMSYNCQVDFRSLDGFGNRDYLFSYSVLFRLKKDVTNGCDPETAIKPRFDCWELWVFIVNLLYWLDYDWKASLVAVAVVTTTMRASRRVWVFAVSECEHEKCPGDLDFGVDGMRRTIRLSVMRNICIVWFVCVLFFCFLFFDSSALALSAPSVSQPTLRCRHYMRSWDSFVLTPSLSLFRFLFLALGFSFGIWKWWNVAPNSEKTWDSPINRALVRAEWQFFSPLRACDDNSRRVYSQMNRVKQIIISSSPYARLCARILETHSVCIQYRLRIYLLCKRKTFNYRYTTLIFVRCLLERIHCLCCLNPIENASHSVRCVHAEFFVQTDVRECVECRWIVICLNFFSTLLVHLFSGHTIFSRFSSSLSLNFFSILFFMARYSHKPSSSQAYRIHNLFAFLRSD